MPDRLHHDALGHEVTARRKELGLSIRDATELSRRIDIEVNGEPGRKPGLGDTTWTKIGQGVKTRRYPHTLHLVDQTLEWPKGTADALLCGDDRPEGDPANERCECAQRLRIGGDKTVNQVLHPERTVPDVLVLDDERRNEVALLRREVLTLIDRVEDLEEEVKALRRIANP